MLDEEHLLGTWRCVQLVSSAAGIHPDAARLTGAEFRLDRDGCLTWTTGSSCSSGSCINSSSRDGGSRNNSSCSGGSCLPLFHCQAYEVVRVHGRLLLRLSGWRGNSIELVADLQESVDAQAINGGCLASSELSNSAARGAGSRLADGLCAHAQPILGVASATLDNYDNFLSPSLRRQRRLQLSLDWWGQLSAIQISLPEVTNDDRPFSLLAALEDETCRPAVVPPWLEADLSHHHNAAVAGLVRHYLYSHALPPGCRLETVNAAVEYVNQLLDARKSAQSDETSENLDDRKAAEIRQPEELMPTVDVLQNLVALCRRFAELEAIQTELMAIVVEMEEAVNHLILQLGGKLVDTAGRVLQKRNKKVGRALVLNPPRLVSLLKSTLQTLLLVTLKLLQFLSRISQLRPDCHQLTDWTKMRERIVSFALVHLRHGMAQLSELLRSVHYATCELTSALCQDLAAHISPEVEAALYLTTNLGLLARDLMDIGLRDLVIRREAVKIQEPEGRSQQQCLEFLLLAKSVHNLREFRPMTNLLEYMRQEQEAFTELLENDKIRLIGKQMEQMVDELPLLIFKLDKFTNAIKAELKPGRFWYHICLIGSAIFDQLAQLQPLLEPTLQHLTGDLDSPPIQSALVALGLLRKTGAAAAASASTGGDASPITHKGASPGGSKGTCAIRSDAAGLNLTADCCTPPLSRSSRLAQMGLSLFQTKIGSDVEFELRQDAPSPLTFTSSEAVASQRPVPVARIVAAHRAIVCARCPWFRRCLSPASGMRESRDGRIVLHDADPDTFEIFLRFLYSGLLYDSLDEPPLSHPLCGDALPKNPKSELLEQYPLSDPLDTPSQNTEVPTPLVVEKLADLLLLADRYECPDLGVAAEAALVSRLDESCAVALFVLADRLGESRATLRRAAFDYLAARPHLLNSENLGSATDLPEYLRAELESLSAWLRLPVLSGDGSKS